MHAHTKQIYFYKRKYNEDKPETNETDKLQNVRKRKQMTEKEDL